MRVRTISDSSGFTVVELLIAATITVAILAMAAVFLSQQTQLQRTTQNRTELQDRIRTGLQLMSQDLALTGNSAVMATDGARLSVAWPGCFDGAAGCLEVTDSGRAMRVRYLSSQFTSGNECRDVSYRLTGDGVLERSDVACGGTEEFVGLADRVISFEATVHCSSGDDYNEFPNAGCPPKSGYGRSITTTLIGQSRSPGTGLSAPGCPTDFLCFEMTQETMMPNMKDQ